MNTKALVVLLVALQCGALLTQAVRPLDEEAAHGSLRKVLQQFASSNTETFAKSNDANGFASTKLDTISTGGNIDAKAKATSEALSIAINAVAKSTSGAIYKVQHGGKAAAAADAVAEAVGAAIAKAKAASYVEIKSDGAGNAGCGTASADAEAEAEAYVVAIAEVFAKAVNRKAKAFIYEKLAVIQRAYAQASAETDSQVCLYGKGYGVSVQKSYALAISKIFVKAYADALAYVFHYYSGAKSKTEATTKDKQEVKAESVDFSQIDGTGEASGFTDGFAATDTESLIKEFSFP